jgi:Oxidoreductase molybdopterin binding domain
MASATLDRLLAILVLGVGATGLVSLRTGSVAGAWVFVAHDVVALMLGAAVAVKLARSVPRAVRQRSFGRLALGLVLALIVVGGLAGGIAWVVSGRLLTVGSLTVMTLHAWAGLVLVPIVVAHLLPRRWRLVGPSSVRAASRRPISRRAVLSLAALAAVGVVGVVTSWTADSLLGRARRFTGSRLLASGTVPPATTFIADAAPAIDPAFWHVRVHGLVETPSLLDLGALAQLAPRETIAVLDCTSGWAVESAWQGVGVADVLAISRPTRTARRLVVRSATGWAAAFDLAESPRLLLATGVAGGPLPAANGAPCRLVAPDHRGLDWVKWVTEIEVA